MGLPSLVQVCTFSIAWQGGGGACKEARVRSSTHHHLMLRLRMSGDTSLLLIYAIYGLDREKLTLAFTFVNKFLDTLSPLWHIH
jgi:hypothetical protein